jgi:hypothetical protein
MSDSIKSCPTCGTKFINNVHYWSGTGKKGNQRDLAGLVCNNIAGDRPCINPCRGMEGGDTWAKRAKAIDRDLSKLAQPTGGLAQLDK